MKLDALKRIAYKAILIGGLVGYNLGYAATPPWPDNSYTYYADKKPLPEVLKEFSHNFGVYPLLSPQVKGMVNGKLTANNPSDFLDHLAGLYGITWYYYAGTLYINKSSEVTTRSIPASSAGMLSLKQALNELGILDTRFGWGELPEQGLALVSGPPPYVELIAKTVTNLPLSPSGLQTAVFRLKYASVDDRTIFFRDKQIVTPGLATTLRNLISNNRYQVGSQIGFIDALSPIKANTAAKASTGPATDMGTTNQGVSDSIASIGGPNTRNGTKINPVIEADSRLNAIIIKDTPENMPVYERLIALLDSPVALIEIQAMILDVNTSRLKDLGIKWSAKSGHIGLGFGNPRADTANSANTITGVYNANPSTLVLNGADYLISRVQLLESNGDARIVSKPSILTVDNLAALLDLSETFYIRVSGERVADVVPIATGIMLKVTPRLIEQDKQRKVQLVVDIEDGSLQDQKIDGLPTIRKSTVSTQALVLEDESLLIGGYISEEDITQKDQVPLLGDIPIVGNLFKHENKNRQRRERLFLITPKIISAPLTLSNASSPALSVDGMANTSNRQPLLTQ